MARRTQPAVVDEKWSAFIQGGVSVVASSRDAGTLPFVARASGCRVSRNRASVTILLSRPRSEPLLEAVASTRAIAVVFCEPSTHVSVQLKGTDAQIVAARPTDARVVERYLQAFAADMEPLGFTDQFVRTLAGCESAELAAVSFTPTAVFWQTPGARAGEPLANHAHGDAGHDSRLP